MDNLLSLQNGKFPKEFEVTQIVAIILQYTKTDAVQLIKVEPDVVFSQMINNIL